MRCLASVFNYFFLCWGWHCSQILSKNNLCVFIKLFLSNQIFYYTRCITTKHVTSWRDPSPRHCALATRLFLKKSCSGGEATPCAIWLAKDLNLRFSAPKTNALLRDLFSLFIQATAYGTRSPLLTSLKLQICTLFPSFSALSTFRVYLLMSL